MNPVRILLVEDNPTDVFVIRRVLMRHLTDLDLRVAANGQEALLYLRQISEDLSLGCPSLILLDLNLPKVSGLDLLKEIRRGMRCGQSPVIIVSSSAAREDVEAARKFGAEDYFQKPNDLESYGALGDLVRKHLPQANP